MAEDPMQSLPSDRVAANASPDLAQQRKAEILQAAARVITQRGADHARLVDIAAEANVSVGMIQHYFRTRSNLLSEVFSKKLEDSLLAYEDSHQDGRAAAEDVVELCYLLTRAPFDEIYSLWLEFFSLANRDRNFRDRSGQIYERWVQVVRDVISKGVETGEFNPVAPAEILADELVSLADGLGIRVLLRHPRMTPTRMFELLVEMMSQALRLDLHEVARKVDHEPPPSLRG